MNFLSYRTYIYSSKQTNSVAFIPQANYTDWATLIIPFLRYSYKFYAKKNVGNSSCLYTVPGHHTSWPFLVRSMKYNRVLSHRAKNTRETESTWYVGHYLANCTNHGKWLIMNAVEQNGWKGKQLLGENLLQYRFVHRKSHMYWSGLELRPPPLEAGRRKIAVLSKFMTNKKNRLGAISPQVKYIDRKTATGRRILAPVFAGMELLRGQRGGSLVAVNLSFLYRSH
jgi:hypothetical protein